jgi:hypothetical protein
MGIKYYFQFFIIISLLYSFKIDTKAQDSLYLVGTITGESYEKRITDVKGIGDVNRDGYGDFVVTNYFDKTAKLYFGSASLDLIPDLTFHYPESEDSVRYFGIAGGIGDVNNDGYDDFSISGTFLAYGLYPKGKVFIYLGGETIDTIPVAEFNEPWIEDSFGETSSVGDINKDNYDDFIITSPYNWSDAKGRVYLFWGGDTVSWERSITFTSDTLEDRFGASVDNIGDINDDGFDDIAISAIGMPDWDSGRVYVYFGDFKIDTQSDTILFSGGSDLAFGRIIKNAGDLDKNGSVDFCVMSSDSIYIYLSDNPQVIKGYSFDSRGDINGDTFSDLIIGNERKINIFLGSENFNAETPNIIVEDSLRYSTAYIYMVGDLNDDGYDEIMSFAPNWPSADNPEGKVYIYSYKNIVGVKEDKDNFPQSFRLYQNYPNPFNPSTVIRWRLAAVSVVRISIYDILGREVATVLNEEQSAGEHEIEFNALKYNLSSGVYFYELKTDDFALRKKMVLLR